MSPSARNEVGPFAGLTTDGELPQLRPWLGEFVSAKLERAYRHQARDHLRLAVRGVLAAIAVGFVAAGLAMDIPRVEAGNLPAWLPWFRAGWLLVGLAIFVSLRPRRTVEALNWALLLTTFSFLAWFSVVAYHYGLSYRETERHLYFGIVILSVMVIAPWSLRFGWAAVLAIFASFVGVEFLLRTPLAQFTRELSMLVVSGAIGFAIAVRLQRARRHEFLLLLEERRRKAELARDNQQLSERLQQAQKMDLVGRLASGVAHDFNNVLQAIFGYTELARDSVPDSAAEDLDGVHSAAQRGAQLVRRLLAMGRKQVARRRSISLNEVTESLLEMLERLMPSSVILDFVPSSDLPAISADPGQLEQVVMNLVVNARDAMPEGGRIVVRTDFERDPRGGKGTCVLRVADQGAGMPPEVRERIFDAFFTTKGPGAGTGLGLSTTKSIVEDHGGHIAVDSQMGRGTTFTVRLPAVGGAESRQSVSGTLEPTRGNGERVLLVEDDPTLVSLLARTLRQAGYDVVQATDGLEGLTAVERYAGELDLVLSDLDMPFASGIDVYQAVRKQTPEIPVIITSALGAAKSSRVLLEDPRAGFLAKPFTASQLLRLVRRLLMPPPSAVRTG